MPIAEHLRTALRHPRFIPYCLALCVLTRVALIFGVPVEPSSDAQWYFNQAAKLATQHAYAENGYPTAYWPIGYPAMLAGIFWITGTSLVAAKLANLVFAAAAFICFYLLCRRLFDESTARVAVLLLTLYPNNAAFVPLVLTEHLYTALLLGGALAATFASGRALVVAGVLFGAATLVKTQTMLIAPALACVLMWRSWRFDDLARAVARAVAICAVMLVVVAPWSWRNYATFGTFVLVSTNGGMSLLAGNNPSVLNDFGSDYSEEDPLIDDARWSVADQVAADGRARTLALRWISDHPGDFIRLIPKKIFRLWAPDGESEWQYQAGTPGYSDHRVLFRGARIFNQLFYVAVLLLSALALIRLIRARAPPDLYAGFVLAVATTALSVVFSGQSRYHFPVMPFLLAYAAYFAVSSLRSREGVRGALQTARPM